MLSNSSNAFRTTSMIFILVTILVFILKPSVFFSQRGSIKTFGLLPTEHETPITVVMFTYGLMVLIYLLILYLEKKWGH